MTMPSVPAVEPMTGTMPSATDFVSALRRAKNAADLARDQKLADEGGFFDSALDKGAALAAGLPGVAKSFFDVGRLISADSRGAVMGSEYFDDVQKRWRENLMSESGKAAQRLLERPMNDPNAGVTDVLSAVAANPDAAVNMAIESLPTMIASVAGGTGTALGAKVGAKLLGKELSKRAAAKAATAGSVGTNALMNAGDTFTSEAVKDEEMARRYQGAAASGALSLLAGKLFDGGAEGMLARGAMGQNPAGGIVRRVASSTAKEGGQEAVEEGSNALGEQVARREFSPSDIAKRGAFGGAIGSIAGGSVGALSRGSGTRSDVAPSEDRTGEPNSRMLDLLKARKEAEAGKAAVEERLERPEAKLAEEKDSIVGAGKEVGTAQVLPGSERVVRVQNRDRSSSASVGQMTNMAANLDYGRMSPGRDFGNGAPVVSYGEVDEAHKGKTDYAVTADGERIPVQYAVVEVSDILTSNDSNGNPIKEYVSAGPERMRAIAGNGRIAATQRAYGQGSADKYRQDMLADAESFGVSPDVIEQMKSPVLVRIMPEDKIRTDVGSISNTSTNMDMSIVEKAADDAANIDFSTLEFDENGNPTDETIRQFVGRFPAGQAAGMMGADGRASQQAKARFGAALFKKAYNNDQLTRIYAESTDGEAKGMLNALAATAGKMVRLEGGGDLDLRDAVAEAAEIIINARREGRSVAEYVADGSLGQSAEAAIIAEALDAHKRSGKEMTRILAQAADSAFEAMSGQDALFGEPPTRESIIEKFKEERDAKRTPKHAEPVESERVAEPAVEVDEDVADGGREEAASSDVQRESAEPEGHARAEESGKQEAVEDEATGQGGELKFSRSAISTAKDKIRKLLDRYERLGSHGSEDPESTVDYLPVGERLIEQAKDFGLDISGFRHSIDESGIAHVLSGHGEGREKGQGQIPVALEDFLQLPEVVTDPDVVRPGGSTRRHKLPVIIFEKTIDDGRVIVAEEVRKGRKRLMLHTAYIKEPSGQRAKHQGDVASRKRPKRAEVIPDGSIVSQFGDAVSDSEKKSRRGEVDGHERKDAAIEVDRALESDSDVGEAYRAMRDDGRVAVVDGVRDVPTDVRARGKLFEGDDGGIQGLFDPRTGTAYIIANNVTTNTAKGVFLHEIGVHMAFDQKEEVKALALRARNMVNNGAKQGDSIAVAVKRRMVDAGILAKIEDDIEPRDSEEAFAYLVEVAANADARSPFRKWLDSVVAKIKQWLARVGIKVRLTADEYVEIARGNADGLAGVRGRRLKVGEGFKKSVVGKSVKEYLGGDWGKAIQVDSTGRKYFAWGEHALVGGTKVALDVLEAAIPALRTSYAIRYARPEVRRMIREYAARCDAAMQEAGVVSQDMLKWTANDRELLSDTIEGMLKPGVHPPQYVVEAAQKMSDLMTEQAKELVELGMLSEKAAARWRGQYLPRFYKERDPILGEQWFKNLFKRSAPIRGVGGGSLKGRGCYKVVDLSAVPDFVRLGWEVRDARYEFSEKQQKVVDLKDSKALKTGIPVTIWRDWTPSERLQMGEIRDGGYRFTMGWMQTQQDIALGRLFKSIAENLELSSKFPEEGFSPVPDTEISDTGGVKKYGALAGMYVRDDVLASIMPHTEVPSGFMRAWKKLMAYWKEGKTALNPVSHMNNVAGNVIMAHLAGVNMWDAKAYVDTILDIANHEEWIDKAQKAGLYSGLFSREEIEEMLPEEFRKLMTSEQSAVGKGADWVFTYLLNYGLRKNLRDLYEFEDKLFRLVIYKSALDRGLEPKEAVDYTLGFIPTYDDLPGGARAIRDTAIPFFAWTYKTLPTIILSAVKYPHRFVAPAVILTTVNMLSYAMAAGDDDDDWFTRIKKGLELQKAEEKLLPEYMRGRGAFANPKFLRLWTDETTGMPVYWNISNFIPGGQMFDVNNQMGGMPFPEVLNISSPAYSVYCALFLNLDTFMGQELVKSSDTGMEAAEKRAAYLWRQLAPALAYGGYHAERIMNAMANATGEPIAGYTGIGRNGQSVTPFMAGLNTIGIKVRDVDFEVEYQRRVGKLQAEAREIRANMRSMAKRMQTGATTPEAGKDYIEEQRQKMKDVGRRLRELGDANDSRERLKK